jgi:hypothetical protein
VPLRSVFPGSEPTLIVNLSEPTLAGSGQEKKHRNRRTQIKIALAILFGFQKGVFLQEG